VTVKYDVCHVVRVLTRVVCVFARVAGAVCEDFVQRAAEPDRGRGAPVTHRRTRVALADHEEACVEAFE